MLRLGFGTTVVRRRLWLGVASAAFLVVNAAFAGGRADPANVVVEGQVGDLRHGGSATPGRARFTVLSPNLLRLEYAEDGVFEDRPSFFAVNRDAPPQKFELKRADGYLELRTKWLGLRYKQDSGPFTAENLRIILRDGAKAVEWKPGVPNVGNLGGTVRTLDGCRGPIDLGQGVLSRDGWYLLDDSRSILFSADLPEPVGAASRPRPDGDEGGSRDEQAASDRLESLDTQRGAAPRRGLEAAPTAWAPTAWATTRRDGARLDWYFFGYGHDFDTALRDLTTVGGRIPLPPKFALGSWYSRYWPYKQEEFLQIADEYASWLFPLDVMVIDMDWHLDGWTGYTWNPKLIPDPDALLKGLRERGLKVTLNLHPAEGVGPQEKAYPEFAQAMGVDPESKHKIKWDIADPQFARNYFDLLLHPLEVQGVDFWWMDWQQENTTSIAGLDPLPWLNHLHFLDRQRVGAVKAPDDDERDAGRMPAVPDADKMPAVQEAGKMPAVQEVDRMSAVRGADETVAGDDGDGEAKRKPPVLDPYPLRGMCFSRWGGLGDQRHPIQFSGDAESTWSVLKFEIPFTATAGNVGAAYWSHDLGGHWSSAGRVDAELFTRWIQFGAFSPVVRVHSTRDTWNDRRPWLYEKEFTDANRAAYDLRYQLMPYIYTMARKCYDTGLPLVRPMYLMYPRQTRAYDVPHQYLFGDDLLVAPATEPGYGRARLVDVPVWFPEGDWFDLTTHERYHGPTDLMVTVPLERIPVFARAGAPIPMQRHDVRSAQDPLESLIVRLYPGPAAKRELYEDDGETLGYLAGAFRRTTLTSDGAPQREASLTLGPSEGTFAAASPGQREVLVDLAATVRPAKVEVRGGAGGPGLAWSYDPLKLTASIGVSATSLDAETVVQWSFDQAEDRVAAIGAVHRQAQRLALTLGQLPPDHPLTGPLAAAAHELTAYYTKLADPLAGGAVSAEEAASLLERTDTTFRTAAERLSKNETPDDRDALRALTGLSLEVATTAGSDSGKARVIVTIRGGAADPERPDPSFDVRLSVIGEPPESARTKPGRFAGHASTKVEFELDVDPTKLSVRYGGVMAAPSWNGVPVLLRRAFEHNDAVVRDWLVVGPFPGGKGPDAEQFGPEQTLDLSASYTGRDGAKITWTTNRADPQTVVDGFIDVVNFRPLYNCENATAFATTTLVSETATTVDFLFRHDDGAIVWVNGEEVYRSTKPRALFDGEGRFPVKLRAGENTVLVKVDQLGYGWGFRLGVAASAGSAFPELRCVRPQP